jgi:hypothetical protein
MRWVGHETPGVETDAYRSVDRGLKGTDTLDTGCRCKDNTILMIERFGGVIWLRTEDCK